MNREEFITEYSDKFQEIRNLCFSDKENFLYTTISDDPKQYTDVASRSGNLRHILLESNGDSEYYKSVTEFIASCNDTVTILNGPVGKATKQEFLRSEEIIEDVIGKIDTQWTTKQKAAFIHYEIGKLISYAPDFCFSGKYVGAKAAEDARNIWKSIDNGESVCNGIATIERNILSRVGINTKELSSGTHTYVMIETEEGNILSDPTWDLSNTLFEGRPMYFGKTYEQLQQIDGPLSKAHRLENPPENIIEISEEELREIYKSIGIAKDDGKFKFPILDKVNDINSQQFENENDKVQAFLKMFTQDFSKQALHLSETRTMIERCIPALGIEDKSFTTKFVYSKEDETGDKPYLCMHIDSEGMKDNIVILNTEKMQFENKSIQDFDELYRTHKEDTREPFWNKYLPSKENQRNITKDRTEK